MTESTYQYISLDYLNLMTDGDDDMKKVMLDMLFEELPTEMEKINALVASQDWEELKQVTHKMKSTLSFIGNDLLTESNREVEYIAKTQTNVYKLPELLAILNKFTPKVLIELKKEYNKI